MGSLRSWLGSLVTLVVFFLARRFTAGVAAPTFLTLFFACTYIWMLVLRVPELKGIEPAEEEQTRLPVPFVTRADTEAASSAAAAVSSTPEVAANVATSSPTAETVHTDVAEEAEVVEAPEAEALELEPLPETAPVSSPSAGSQQAPAATTEEYVAESSDVASVEASASPPVTSASRAPTAAEDSDASDDEEALKRQEEELENEHCDAEKARELKTQGNEHFKAGKLHDAREAYSEALYLMPSDEKKEKAVLFGNRAACLQKLSRWEDVVEDCKKAIELDPEYAKAYHRRSGAYEALEKWHDANEDLKKVIELDPSMKGKEYKHQAVLGQRAAEQFEKDKDEMVGKLKDLGNMVLGKFGMSCDNFKCEKDPSSGSYSIKFQQ